MERRRGGQERSEVVRYGDRSVVRSDGPEVSRAERDTGIFPTLAQVEREHVRLAMRRSHGNKAAAARLLGISRMTLYRKLDGGNGVSDK